VQQGCSELVLHSHLLFAPSWRTIVRVSERRCGIRRSVLDRFNESLQSAVTVTGKNTARRRLGIMATKRNAEVADGAP